jgi:hypothetical protein
MLECWNVGIMEYWESKTDEGLILNSNPYHLYKNRPHSAKPSIPTFQYSIIPWHMFTAQPIFSDLAQPPARRVGSTARREDQVFNVRINFVIGYIDWIPKVCII